MTRQEKRVEVIKILARNSEFPERTVDDIMNLFGFKCDCNYHQACEICAKEKGIEWPLIRK